MKYGPAYLAPRHWLFAIMVVVVPFVAAVYAARGR